MEFGVGFFRFGICIFLRFLPALTFLPIDSVGRIGFISVSSSDDDDDDDDDDY